MFLKSFKTYLNHELPHYISISLTHKYWWAYNVLKIKRFLVQTLIVFIFQYLILMNITLSLPPSPMNPAIGLAFSFFYLLGKSAIPGLILGELCAYLLKEVSIGTLVLYLTADIGFGCIAAYFCNTILSSDIRSFASRRESLQFLKTNATVCLFSSLFRSIGDFNHLSAKISFSDMILFYFDHFIADLNGILILSVFLISWVTIPFTGEKIFRGALTKYPATLLALLILSALLFMNRSSLHVIIIAILVSLYVLFIYGRKKSLLFNDKLKKAPLIVLFIFLILSLLFLNSLKLTFFIILIMFASLYLAYVYGYLIATGLVFMLSSIYMACFANLKEILVQHYGVAMYSFVPIFLFFYIITTIRIGHLKLKVSDVH